MQEPAQGFTGIWIPRELWTNHDLNITDKIIYANIASFAKACFESNEMMANKLGLSEKSITRAIKKLQALEFVYVEYVNGNSSSRRIYAIMDNPKKIAYLVKRGLFRGEAEFSTGGGQIVQGGQNVQGGGQIVPPHNRGEGGQFVHQRINKNKKKNKEEAEQEPNTAGTRAVSSPRPARRPRRSEFESEEDFERALYLGVAAKNEEGAENSTN